MVTKNAAIQKLSKVIQDLPEAKRKEVVDFAEYLQYREIEQKGITAEVTQGIQDIKSKKYRPARDIFNEL